MYKTSTNTLLDTRDGQLEGRGHGSEARHGAAERWRPHRVELEVLNEPGEQQEDERRVARHRLAQTQRT